MHSLIIISWCRNCYFFLLWDGVLCWSCNIPVCDWPSAEAVLRLQLQEMGSDHWPEGIPYVCIPHNGFKSCSSRNCCIHDLASSRNRCIDCSASFLGWLCGPTSFRGSTWKTWLILLAHCSNSLWGKLMCSDMYTILVLILPAHLLVWETLLAALDHDVVVLFRVTMVVCNGRFIGCIRWQEQRLLFRGWCLWWKMRQQLQKLQNEELRSLVWLWLCNF